MSCDFHMLVNFIINLIFCHQNSDLHITLKIRFKHNFWIDFEKKIIQFNNYYIIQLHTISWRIQGESKKNMHFLNF